MTIYSQHPNRGKIQILATYIPRTGESYFYGGPGASSTTVTSVPDQKLADRIVDTLNLISACATLPVSIHDIRNGDIGYYPSEHLDALTDRGSRAGLLTGAHSLWYEQVKTMLHEALTDLDDALTSAPPPVRTAIDAELQKEAQELRAALAEFSEGTISAKAEDSRSWDFDFPFVAFNGGNYRLSREACERLDGHERNITEAQRTAAVDGLRLLLNAYSEYSDAGEARLELSELSIHDEPYEADRYYLVVSAPRPWEESADHWLIEIGRWEPDDPSEGDDWSSATGETVLLCDCPAPPAAAELTALLNRNADPKQLIKWAQTPVGELLDGTPFAVTRR